MNVRRLLKRYCPRSLYLPLRSAYNRRKKTVSQLGQDFWVFGEAFNEMHGGYFIEIGAADGITFSNTFLLETRYGWHGLCIEANPLLFAELHRVRRATCLNVCVDSGERETEFVLNRLGSGIVADDTDNRGCQREAAGHSVIRVETKDLYSILQAQSSPRTIDYLSIDVEGAEDRILAAFPFGEYRFNCLTVERPKELLRKALRDNGYILIKELPKLDAFYVHESFHSQYICNVFDFWEKCRCS